MREPYPIDCLLRRAEMRIWYRKGTETPVWLTPDRRLLLEKDAVVEAKRILKITGDTE